VNLLRLLGARGERAAKRFLVRRVGHRFVRGNYRCAAGEIDLITLDGVTIVFVEVKTRSSDEYAYPHDAVDEEKRRRLKRAARYFLMRARLPHQSARFDIVSIVWSPRGRPVIEHFPDAFPAYD
jgi:putative endonuclease